MKIRREWPEIPGVEYYTDDVKAAADGTVLYIGKQNGLYVVTVQCNANECLRYCNLKTCDVDLNDSITEGSVIGIANKYVCIEYCTTGNKNRYVVRIYNKTYFKQNPMDILEGKYDVLPYKPRNIISGTKKYIQLTPSQQSEFGNSRGDNIVEF